MAETTVRPQPISSSASVETEDPESLADPGARFPSAPLIVDGPGGLEGLAAQPPSAPEVPAEERAERWRTEFLDRSVSVERKIRLLGLLRHVKDSEGADPRTPDVIAEALWLLDQPIDSERREDVLSGLRRLPAESILLKAILLLRDDSGAEVRGDAAKLLGGFDDERATAALEWSATNDPSERVRNDCTEALLGQQSR